MVVSPCLPWPVLPTRLEEETRTNIHAFSGTRTHGRSGQTHEDHASDSVATAPSPCYSWSTKDSACPPMKDGEVRLYGMRFCPFTQRVRIVLNAKNIPHNVVNINLKNQPEWYFKIHPDGKVPALDTGNEVVLESLDIADFLDEKFPDPPLYPNDPELKSRDKEFIKKFGKVVGATSRALHNTDNLPVEEYLKDILEPLEEFEAELTNRGTTFFGGDNPGMLDYIMWPWSERSKVPSALQDKEFHFQKEKFPTLVAWRDAMKDVNAVRDTITSLETHVKFLKGYSGANPEFDNL
ncbi:pyrimidodiazepine synthase-like isoform X1 [Zootermopsis nevadensis]|uniref:pyrimidodiazepine synthase-like isoform X1 n=1 Tax=Zootermopsis nevadensis TaxID=136037 RepID=UPI000B8EB412|nr:pyrimidodiazepine synthase-like isoform X1 [Zootermopsis nevadensis]